MKLYLNEQAITSQFHTSSIVKFHECRYKELECDLVGEYIETNMDKNDTFLEYVKKSSR